jgi:type IV pilus assembly protein PilA
MKKTNNKGFSLVELIIVIAIMAILAASLAPALIRYIDKSRRSSDLTSASSIKSAFETAITDEAANSEVQSLLGTSSSVKLVDFSTDGTISVLTSGDNFKTEFTTNLKVAKVKVKYTKNGATHFSAYVDKNMEMSVYAVGGTSSWQLVPDAEGDYK